MKMTKCIEYLFKKVKHQLCELISTTNLPYSITSTMVFNGASIEAYSPRVEDIWEGLVIMEDLIMVTLELKLSNNCKSYTSQCSMLSRGDNGVGSMFLVISW